MPLVLSLIVGELAGAVALTEDQTDGLARGGLDPDQVYFEYVTQHDSRVRPSHAALDGSVWKLGDPFAPVPPLDYGCRCSLKYCGKPGTTAARILPEAKALPTTRAAVYAKHLDEVLPDWRELAGPLAKTPSADRLGALTLVIKAKGSTLTDARDLAMMIIEAWKPDPT